MGQPHLFPAASMVRGAVDHQPRRHLQRPAALDALLHALSHVRPFYLTATLSENLRRLRGSRLWPPLVLPDPEALGVELHRGPLPPAWELASMTKSFFVMISSHASQISAFPGPPPHPRDAVHGQPTIGKFTVLRMRRRSAWSIMAATFR